MKNLEKLNHDTDKKKPSIYSKGKKGKVKSTKLDIIKKPTNIHKALIFKGKMFWWCSSKTRDKCNGLLRHHKSTKCKGAAFLKSKKEQEKKLVTEESIAVEVNSNSKDANIY